MEPKKLDSSLDELSMENTRKLVGDLVRQACNQLDAYSKGILASIRSEISTNISSLVAKAIADQLTPGIREAVCGAAIELRTTVEATVDRVVTEAVDTLDLEGRMQVIEENISTRADIAIEAVVTELTRRSDLNRSGTDRNGGTSDRSIPEIKQELDHRLHEAVDRFAEETTGILELEIKPQLQLAVENLVNAQLGHVTASLEMTAAKSRSKIKKASKILGEHAKAAIEATSSAVVHRRIREAYSSCTSIWPPTPNS